MPEREREREQDTPAHAPAPGPAPGPVPAPGDSSYSYFYSPERVDYWLRHWLLLSALAEQPGPATHHLTEEHRTTARACTPAPRLLGRHGRGQRRGKGPDALRWADVRADLAAALAPAPRGALAAEALERQAALAVARGRSLRWLARRVRRRDAVVW